jgi:hypothetical protein
MQIPLERGRFFNEQDRPDSIRAVVIGAATARRLWPGEDPIGRRVRLGDGTGMPYTVIGVAGDVRHYELSAPPTMQMYLAERQFTDSFVTLVVRAAGEPANLVPPIRQIVHSAAPGIAPAAPTTIEALVARSTAQRRFAMWLLGVFAAIALALAMVGVYGTVAYSVARRTREFGIRIALGARRADIARLVFHEGSGLLLAGVALGSGGALVVTRLLGRLLYGVAPGDPVTLGAIVVLVAIAASIAQAVPMLQATAVDPSEALQAE